MEIPTTAKPGSTDWAVERKREDNLQQSLQQLGPQAHSVSSGQIHLTGRETLSQLNEAKLNAVNNLLIPFCQ